MLRPVDFGAWADFSIIVCLGMRQRSESPTHTNTWTLGVESPHLGAHRKNSLQNCSSSVLIVVQSEKHNSKPGLPALVDTALGCRTPDAGTPVCEYGLPYGALHYTRSVGWAEVGGPPGFSHAPDWGAIQQCPCACFFSAFKEVPIRVEGTWP